MRSSMPVLLLFSFFFLFTLLIVLSKSKPYSLSLSSSSTLNPSNQIRPRLKIYVADLPRSFNYGLLDQYWSLSAPDSRISADPDAELRAYLAASRRSGPLPYPENSLIKQYSAEYWLLGDLETPARARAVSSVVERVYDWRNADVVFVPFFATLSAEMELGGGGREDFSRRKGMGIIGGRGMLSIGLGAPMHGKDPVVGITCSFSQGGLVREKLWDVLLNERDVVMEEGFPNATGREQSIKGMRSSEFCLHPAGDTPTSCRLFDAVLSLCIPVIVSDNIELPFEGMVDYSNFAIFVSVNNALQPGWLAGYLRNFSKYQKDGFRGNMAIVQNVFEYDNGSPGGIGPVSSDGAVNNIWRKVYQKLPMIKEAIIREKRKPDGVSTPLRCHCM